MTIEPAVIIRASVHCPRCDDAVEATEDCDKFQYCSCGKSWVKGFHSLSGHNTSILMDRSGQLRWEL